mmetsp:Transcript_11901/g.16124  ORF Transcript_11901/g.16124 Transcript_11901/m.16124 type:complete len:233 (+) Transcript_11901:34-732(+)
MIFVPCLLVCGYLLRKSECFLIQQRKVVETRSWEEARSFLEKRSVSSVIIKDGFAHLIPSSVLNQCSATDLSFNLQKDDDIESLQSYLKKNLSQQFFQDKDLQKLLNGYRKVTQTDKSIRFRLLIADSDTRMVQPCPRLHTDNVYLRCLIPVLGAGTVVTDRSPPFLFDDNLPDSAFYKTSPGDILLLKGRKFGQGSSPAYHRSPIPIDNDLQRETRRKRILLSLDRLEDLL